jgi:segregation and condensation protein B
MSGTEDQEITDVAAKVSDELKQTVEALLFASDEPLPIKMIRDVIDEGNQQREPSSRLEASNDDVRAVIIQLNKEYGAANRAFHIMQLAGGYVFATNKKFSMWVGKLFKEKARRKLSATALETLAIIAYKQPITKSEVEFIRGVNADYIMKTLLEKNLVTIVGRATTPGRPLLYGTTADFLKHFGLNEITDLPKPREIEELIGETEQEVDRRLLAEQQEMEFKAQLEEKMTPEQRKERAAAKKHAAPVHQQGPAQRTPASEIPAVPEQPAAAPEESAAVPAEPAAEEAAAAEVFVAEPESAVVEEEPAVEMIVVQEPAVNVREEIAEPVPVEEIEPVAASAPEMSEVHEPEPAAAMDEQHMQTAAPEEMAAGEQPQKGWSKWKTKLQTFFRKLFA